MCNWLFITCHSFPSRDHHARPFAHARRDFKLIREPFSAAQAQPQSATRSVTVFQRQFDIRNARSLVFKSQPQPPARLTVEGLEPDGPAAAVVESVAREFAGRGHDLGLVYETETLGHRPLASSLPHAYDVLS